MTQKIGLAVIGLGMASLPHARSLQALADRVEVAAAYSPSATRRREFCERFGFPAVDGLDRILDDDGIAAVLLLTPPNARLELVQALAGRGKHILMEKPLERTLAAAERIVTVCEAARVRLGVVFQHRFRDGALALRERLASGALGHIHMAQLNVPWWRPQSYYDEPGRGSYARDGGGVLISQAIHSLDLMLSLLGPVDEVAAIAGTTGAHRMESEDFVGAGLRFRSGALGALAATTANYPGASETLTLSGSEASATLSGAELLVVHRDGRRETVGESTGSGGGADPMAFPHDWHQRLIEDFLDAIGHRREPLSHGREALQVQRLIEMLVKSAAERRHIRLREICPEEARPGQLLPRG